MYSSNKTKMLEQKRENKCVNKDLKCVQMDTHVYSHVGVIKVRALFTF